MRGPRRPTAPCLLTAARLSAAAGAALPHGVQSRVCMRAHGTPHPPNPGMGEVPRACPNPHRTCSQAACMRDASSASTFDANPGPLHGARAPARRCLPLFPISQPPLHVHAAAGYSQRACWGRWNAAVCMSREKRPGTWRPAAVPATLRGLTVTKNTSLRIFMVLISHTAIRAAANSGL